MAENSRLFNGTSDRIDVGFGLNVDDFTVGMWIKSADISGASKSLWSNLNNVAGTLVGFAFRWDGSNLIIDYRKRTSPFNAGTNQVALDAGLVPPHSVPIFVALTATYTAGIPTFRFYAGNSVASIVQQGSDQVAADAIKTHSRDFNVGASYYSDTTSDHYFSGYVQRVGWWDDYALTLDELQFFARTGSPATVGDTYETNGVCFNFHGNDPEFDSGINMWTTQSITGTSVEAPIVTSPWTFRQSLFSTGLVGLSTLAFIRVNADILVGGKPSAQVWRSADEGQTWTQQGSLGTETECVCMLYLGSNVVLAGSSPLGKIFKSTNNGSTWSEIQQLGTSTLIHCLLDLGGGTVLAGSNVGGTVYQSTDSGATWASLSSISGQTDVNCLLNLGGGVILAGVGANKIYQSTDSGATWSLLATLTPGTATNVVHLFAVSATVILACTSLSGGYGGDVYQSTDTGATWTRTYTSFYNRPDIFVGPIFGNYYISLGQYGWVLESSDSGASWTRKYVVSGVEWSNDSSIFALASSLIVATVKNNVTDANISADIWELAFEPPPPPPTGLLITQVAKIYQFRELPPQISPTCSLNFKLRILRVEDLLPVLELDEYQSLTYTKRLTDLDSYQLNMSMDSPQGVRMRELGIVPSSGDYILNVLLEGLTDFAGFIDRCKIDMMSDGRHTVEISGNGLDRMLADRIIVPQGGDIHDSYDDVAETVIKSIVDRHLVNPIASGISTFNDPLRAVTQLLVAVDNGNGSPIKFEGRFQKVIDAIQEVSRGSDDMGFGFTIIGSFILFDIILGQDRSHTAVFSVELNNVGQFTIDRDGLNFASDALMAGQGEDTARQLQNVFGGAFFHMNIKRRETFVDARDLDTFAKLIDRGDSILQEKARTDVLSVLKLPGLKPCYKEDFDLGDIVTLQSQLYGITQQVRIYEVQITLVGGQAQDIKLTFDKPTKKFTEAMKSAALSATSRT